MAGYYSQTGSYRRSREREDTDPLASMANFGDVMLVFACGLMVALVVAWNVDLGKFAQVDVDENSAIEDPDSISHVLEGEGMGFIERGTVYQDPITGKYYLVEETDANASGNPNVQGNPNAQGSAGNAGANPVGAGAGANANNPTAGAGTPVNAEGSSEGDDAGEDRG